MSTSPSLSVDLPAREQCLRNSDLIGEILGHIRSESSGSDRDNLKAERRSLLSIASTCKAMSPSAIRFLWRRLDNLMPLLQLLPAFGARNGISGLFGAMQPRQWEAFDRHAVYVQEIVHGHEVAVEIDPSVYVQLVLHKAPTLPNVRRLVCATSAQPSASEMLVYMQSPLQAIELGSADLTIAAQDTPMDRTREIITSSLSARPNHISTLIVVRQPFSVVFADLEHLTSLELTCCPGGIDATLLRRIGYLPRLHCSELLPGGMSSPVFPYLWSLPICDCEETRSGCRTTKLRSLILEATGPYPARPIYRSRPMGEPDSLRLRRTLNIIASRWSQSLCQLYLAVDADYQDITILRQLTSLRTLKLAGRMHNTPRDSIPTMFIGLNDLETLSFHCRCYSDARMSNELRLCLPVMKAWLSICPKLREFDLTISVEVPPLSSAKLVSRALRRITLRPLNKLVDTIGFARYLDRLFPCLNTLHYDPAGAGDSETKAAWAHAQQLLFAFQDVRRDALRALNMQPFRNYWYWVESATGRTYYGKEPVRSRYLLGEFITLRAWLLVVG
ncbi:hypothetical protein DFH06DRAFT_1300136 [Mycena polygramma]|nr:hypothetical protein DFH06DRAFT_1300136 [Mycena polygramma]